MAQREMVADALDKLVFATLTRGGRAVSDWFFIEECICFWGPHGDIGDWLTSDDRLYAAVRAYLRRAGALTFGSPAEAMTSRSQA